MIEAAEKCPITRDETAENCPDAGRVAISVSVFYQIDRLKSGFEVRALRSNGGAKSWHNIPLHGSKVAF